jgi:hypothetical protein
VRRQPEDERHGAGLFGNRPSASRRRTVVLS